LVLTALSLLPGLDPTSRLTCEAAAAAVVVVVVVVAAVAAVLAVLLA
jgi:hypothetical protein